MGQPREVNEFSSVVLAVPSDLTRIKHWVMISDILCRDVNLYLVHHVDLTHESGEEVVNDIFLYQSVHIDDCSPEQIQKFGLPLRAHTDPRRICR